MFSGWKPTHLASVFSLQTSVLLPPDGTTLTAFTDVDADVRYVGFLPPHFVPALPKKAAKIVGHFLEKDLKILGSEFSPTVSKLKRDPKLNLLYF